MTTWQQRLALYVGGTLAIFSLWYFFVYAPAATDLSSARRDIEQTQRQLADYNRTVRELPGFLKRNEQLESVRHQLNSSLYAKTEIMELFRQLTDDAQAHSLRLVQISPPISELLELNRQAAVDNAPLFLNLTLDLRGRYIDFGQFIGELETKPYFRSVKNCVVRGGQTTEPAVDMTVSFKALIGTAEVAS
jgi:Tfp pilus assembly protein PilO